MPTPNASSPLGFGLSCTYCTVVLPMPDGSQVAVTAIQPPFGIGVKVGTTTVLPSTTAGRPLLAEDIIRRLSTPRGTLPDTKVPTVLGQYGMSLDDTVFADMTAAAAGQLSAQADSQIRQDERVIQSKTSATLAGDVLIVPINLVDSQGPVKLVISIDTLNNNLSVLSSPQ